MSQLILVAEDDPDMQLVARLALKRAGFRVEVADNGRQLLERVRIERPDVVLLDWMMPEMDGPETCRRLKAEPATREIPVIFLTAKSEDGSAMVSGAIGQIAKPFDPLKLGQQVTALIQAGVRRC